MKTLNPNSLIKVILPIILLAGILHVSACKNKDDHNDFIADFTYEYLDDNTIRYTNGSEGEYYSLIWDFGNGQKDTTTDKKKSYDIYYPLAGDYNVTLKLMNYSGEGKTAEQSVKIAVTDLSVSFTAEPDPSDPNFIILTNTSLGEYDSFNWAYRYKEIKNESPHSAYFPYAGNFDIELTVIKEGIEHIVSRSVQIQNDDPDYSDKLTLVWSDEFDGSEVNTNNWNFETGATGWGNNELQNYTNGDNAEVSGGNLIITAEKVDDNMQTGSYTSSRMTTQNLHEFQYGKMEIRAMLPEGTGIWPAIWMLGSNFSTAGWPYCGETDIMEYVGYQPNTVHSTVHTPDGYGSGGNGSSMIVETCEEDFHIYGLFWTEREMIFYVDNIENVVHTYAPVVKTSDNWPFDQPAFFILNVAVGGDWGGAQGIDNNIFPQSMEIDYVRVYQE